MPEEALSSITEYSVNLKDQEAPEPLPVGEYTGVIRGAEKKESQRGTMYAAVTFFISSDQFPPDYTDGNPDGTTMIYRRVGLEDNPQARYGTKRFIEAIGAPLGKKIDCSEWVGSEAALEVKHETYEGIKRAVIDRVRAV
jgi:hypothetical protein